MLGKEEGLIMGEGDLQGPSMGLRVEGIDSPWKGNMVGPQLCGETMNSVLNMQR